MSKSPSSLVLVSVRIFTEYVRVHADIHMACQVSRHSPPFSSTSGTVRRRARLVPSSASSSFGFAVMRPLSAGSRHCYRRSRPHRLIVSVSNAGLWTDD